jgi:hypothetical protein
MYNVTTAGKVTPGFTEDYADVIAAHEEQWAIMAGEPLPHPPVVTVGWDVTPRCETAAPWPFPPSPLTGRHDYPYGPVVEGNTPERFADLCARARRFCRETRPTPYAVFINAWNEWTEGSFLLPEERTGTGYLEAIREVFGARRPARTARPSPRGRRP